MGVQVVALRYNDELALRVMKELELARDFITQDTGHIVLLNRSIYNAKMKSL